MLVVKTVTIELVTYPQIGWNLPGSTKILVGHVFTI